jgi:large subunit ribosomal protein L18
VRTIRKPRTSEERRYRRHLRVRKKVRGTAERPRLVVFRSLKHIYAQVVNDEQRRTIVGASDRSEGIAKDKPGKVGAALALGKLVARKAKEQGIQRVVFDRAGYQYHGRIKAVADGAREGGLEF